MSTSEEFRADIKAAIMTATLDGTGLEGMADAVIEVLNQKWTAMGCLSPSQERPMLDGRTT